MPALTIQHPDVVAIRRQVEELVQHQDVDAITGIIVTAQQDRCALQVRVQELLRQSYGSHSEKLQGAQLELVKLAEQMSTKPVDEKEPLVNLPELPQPPPSPQKPARKRGGRKKLSKNLTRRRVVLEPPESDRVASDGSPLTCIGADVREALHYIPGKLEVIEYVMPKYADPEGEPGVVQASPGDVACVARVVDAPVDAPVDACNSSRVCAVGDEGPAAASPTLGMDGAATPFAHASVAIPALPLPGALPTAATLAHVIVEKWRWNMPMYRVAQKFQAMGADISPATLDSWCSLAAPLLVWFYTTLLTQTVQSRVMGTDDTPVKTLDRNTARNIKRSHLWLHVGEGVVAYQYVPDWSGDPVCEVLKHHTGPLQSDGYSGINKLFGKEAPDTRIRVGCMMHGRRGFKKALDAKDERAALPLALIGRLYLVEDYADAVGAKGGDARKQIRQQYSAPVMDALETWLNTNGQRAVPKSPLGKAVTYAKNQWATLIRFLDDGDIPLDNGRVERGLRPVGRGRDAWLFFGSDEGGKRAAIFMTCIANCLLHGADPEAWLTDVFTKLAEGWTGRREDLLPAAWAKKQVKDTHAQQLAAA